MTQEEKQLLLVDLCARLPYGVKCHFKYGASEDDIILKCIDGNIARFDYGWYGKFHVIIDHQYIKPYLRPMSSMTEEELNELRGMLYFGYASDDYDNYSHRGIEIKTCLYDDEEKAEYDFEDFELLKDFLLKNHLDYHGLIPMGLALEAPEGMYNTKTE